MKVKVMQGIGDILWVHQKLFNLADEFEYSIQIIPNDISTRLQTRSVEFVKTWPKVKSVGVEIVSASDYEMQWKREWSTKDLIDGKISHFSLNRWLEQGKKLEDLDSHKIEWSIDIPVEEHPVDSKFCCLYVSDDNKGYGECWSIEDWASIFENVQVPIYILGASYEKQTMLDLYDTLKNDMKKLCRIYMDYKPQQVCYMLKNCDFFVGWQSGLNILADQFKTKQVMVYLDWVYPMKDAWVNPENRVPEIFNPTSFPEGSDRAKELLEKNILGAIK
jgi:hypothetical protein